MKNFVKNILLLLVITSIIYFLFKPRYVRVPLLETAGIATNIDFQFTLSPDNRWIVYFEHKFPDTGGYNLIAFDVLNNKKFLIDMGQEINFISWMHNDCWTTDSRYCVMSSEKIIEGTYNTAIDFTDPNIPLFTRELINYKGVLTCSDCFLNKDYTERSDEFDLNITDTISPDKRFIARQIDKQNDILFFKTSNVHLFILDKQKGTKSFVYRNVYYDLHFSSDSTKLYYYSCPFAGACNGFVDHLYYIDLLHKKNFIQKLL